jgi:hypothetical protein
MQLALILSLLVLLLSLTLRTGSPARARVR